MNASSITVVWDPVDCNYRNGDITGYSLQYTVKGSSSSRNLNISGEQTPEAIISGLSAFTNYTVEVAAMTVNGIGVYSDPIDVRTGGGKSKNSDNN